MHPEELLLVKATAFYLVGNYNQAKHVICEILGIKAKTTNKTIIRAYLLKAMVYIKQSKFGEAESVINKALEIAGTCASKIRRSEIKILEGKLALAKGNWQVAINKSRLALDFMMELPTSRLSNPPAIAIEATQVEIRACMAGHQSKKRLKILVESQSRWFKIAKKSFEPDLIVTTWEISYLRNEINLRNKFYLIPLLIFALYRQRSLIKKYTRS